MPPKSTSTKSTAKAPAKPGGIKSTGRSKPPPKKATAGASGGAAAAAPAAPAAAPAAKVEEKPAEKERPDPILVEKMKVKEVFVEDNDNKIRNSERPCALVIDNDQDMTLRFLGYSGAKNMAALDFIKNPSATDDEKERIRLSVVNAVRQGTPLVIDIDATDYDVFMELSKRFDDLEKGLMDALIDRSIFTNWEEGEWYNKIVRDSDGEAFKPHYFLDDNMKKFFLVVVTKNQSPSKELASKFTVFKVKD